MREFLFTFQGLLILLAVLFLWLLSLSFFIFKISRHYSRLTAGITKKDLKSVLNEVLNSIGENKKEIHKLGEKSQILEKEGKFHLQKIGFMRYNPFKSTGGDQSFILSILDDHNNGVVITSLHSRETTRVYAKRVKEGVEEKHELADEERKIIKEAKKGSS